MSTLDSYFGDKLIEYTDEYTATRLQNAVHSLGIDAVWLAKEHTEAEKQLLAGLPNAEIADYLGLRPAGSTDDESSTVVDKFEEAIFDFDDLAKYHFNQVGPYWLSSVEPGELILKSERHTANRVADDIINTTLALKMDPEHPDAGFTFTKVDHLGRSRFEAPVEHADIQAMGLALNRLHEVSQRFAPED